MDVETSHLERRSCIRQGRTHVWLNKKKRMLTNNIIIKELRMERNISVLQNFSYSYLY